MTPPIWFRVEEKLNPNHKFGQHSPNLVSNKCVDYLSTEMRRHGDASMRLLKLEGLNIIQLTSVTNTLLLFLQVLRHNSTSTCPNLGMTPPIWFKVEEKLNPNCKFGQPPPIWFGIEERCVELEVGRVKPQL